MDKTTVYFLGAKEIGLACLQQLVERAEDLNVEIAGVLTNQRSLGISSNDSVHSYCTDHNLQVIPDLDALLEEEDVDIILSVQYHEILEKKHISKAKDIAVNLHMAPLPEYRGCNQFSFAIIDGADFFGTTIHRLEESIDGGDILFEDRFEIPGDIFVKDLYMMTYRRSVSLFKRTLPALIKGNYDLTSQSNLLSQRGANLHFRNEIEEIKKILESWDVDKKKRYFRATWFPPFSPPELVTNEGKIPLDMEWYRNVR